MESMREILELKREVSKFWLAGARREIVDDLIALRDQLKEIQSASRPSMLFEQSALLEHFKSVRNSPTIKRSRKLSSLICEAYLREMLYGDAESRKLVMDVANDIARFDGGIADSVFLTLDRSPLKSAILAIVGIVAIGGAGYLAGTEDYFGYKTRDDCVLGGLGSMQTDAAVRALGAVCQRMYEP